MSRKTKANRRVHHRARQADHAGRTTPRRPPIEAGGFGIVWLCTDPACLEGIHHPGSTTEEAPHNENDPGLRHPGPFSDSSEWTSEGATSGHGTD